MTATLGAALISRARAHVERYGIAHADVAMVDDTVLAPGTVATLTIGTLALVGGITTSGDFGGQARHHWSAGVVGSGVSAWTLTIPARTYHDDGGLMLSVVLADLERDAATAAGATPLGAVLEVQDIRLDADGSWIRPRAIGRDLLDALALAAGLEPGTWWVAADGSTHLGPRPASSVTLSDLTIDPFDPALVRATVRVASDNFLPLLPGASITAPGLTSPLPVGALILTVDGDDISAEVWGGASHVELLSRDVRHMMAAAVGYLGAQPYEVTGVASDGRVAVAAPPGAAFPDAPLLGHAPGIPGATFLLVAPGAQVLVECIGGNPGAPVCVAYPPSLSPAGLAFDVSPVPTYASPWTPAPPSGKITLGGTAPLPLVVAVDASWFAQINAAVAAMATALGAGVPIVGGVAKMAVAPTVPTAPTPAVADKAQASHT